MSDPVSTFMSLHTDIPHSSKSIHNHASIKHLTGQSGNLKWGTKLGGYMNSQIKAIQPQYKDHLFFDKETISRSTDGAHTDHVLAQVLTTSDKKHYWHTYTIPGSIPKPECLSVITSQLDNMDPVEKLSHNAIPTGQTDLRPKSFLYRGDNPYLPYHTFNNFLSYTEAPVDNIGDTKEEDKTSAEGDQNPLHDITGVMDSIMLLLGLI